MAVLTAGVWAAWKERVTAGLTVASKGSEMAERWVAWRAVSWAAY
jgi:hypothetical protein